MGDLTKSLMSTFNRAKQLTAETIGRAEKTEYDTGFEVLVQKTETIKACIEKLLKQMGVYLQPNPNVRLEKAVLSTFKQRQRDVTTEVELLGHAMMEMADRLEPGTALSEAMIKCGRLQLDLGERWCHFQGVINDRFIRPSEGFLHGEIKSVQNERKQLSKLRLDLDTAKSRARKPGPNQQQLAQELEEAQRAFDHQYEVTRILLENVQRVHEDQIHRFVAMVDAQHEFFASAADLTASVGREIRRIAGMEPPNYAQSTSEASAASKPAAAAAAAAPAPAPASSAPAPGEVVHDFSGGGEPSAPPMSAVMMPVPSPAHPAASASTTTTAAGATAASAHASAARHPSAPSRPPPPKTLGEAAPAVLQVVDGASSNSSNHGAADSSSFPMPPASSATPATTTTSSSSSSNSSSKRAVAGLSTAAVDADDADSRIPARVVKTYETKVAGEISVWEDEVVMVLPQDKGQQQSGWLLVERHGKRGRVPEASLEF